MDKRNMRRPDALLPTIPGSRTITPEWISWTNVALGIWLVVAAFLFRHQTGAGITQNIVAGVFVSLAALWAARAFRAAGGPVASWAVVLTRLWGACAPVAPSL